MNPAVGDYQAILKGPFRIPLAVGQLLHVGRPTWIHMGNPRQFPEVSMFCGYKSWEIQISKISNWMEKKVGWLLVPCKKTSLPPPESYFEN